MLKDLEWIIMERAASYGGYSGYTRVGIVLVDKAKIPEGCTEPKMLSSRSKGVVKIEGEYGPWHVGTTERSEYGRHIGEIEDRVNFLNQSLHNQTPNALDLLFALVRNGNIELTDLTEINQVLWDQEEIEQKR